MQTKQISELDKAYHFMQSAHEVQTRWDGKTPYSTHPDRVVKMMELFGVTDKTLLTVGYLHDVLEDTKITPQQILDEFGLDVLQLVKELTFVRGPDDLYLEQVKRLSVKAKLVKVADLIANLTDDGKKSDHFISKRVQALSIIMRELVV